LKKFLISTLFTVALMGLSITAASAAQPGCYGNEGLGKDPTYTGSGSTGSGGTQVYDGVMGAMENHSAALRVRNRAEAREIVHENDNGLGMTCFDHALGLTGRLGAIFSDVAPGSTAGTGPTGYGSSTFNEPNSTVFLSPIVDTNYGTGNSLTTAISNVIQPQLSNHVNEFPDSISKAIGATVANALSGAIMGMIAPLMTAINGAVSAIGGLIATVNGYLSAFKTAMRALQFVIGLPLSPTITVLMTALNSAFAILKQFITTAFHALQTTVMGFVNSMLNQLTTSTANNMTNAGPDCQRIQSLWGSQGVNAPAGSLIANSGQNVGANEQLRALVGTGTQQGVPFLSFADLWTGGGGQSKMGTNMLQELSSGAMNGTGSNSSIINRAMTDLTGTGILSGPQLGSQFWVTTPLAIVRPPAGVLPSSIINAM